MKFAGKLVITILTALLLFTTPLATVSTDAANAYVIAINTVRAQNGVAPMKENTALNAAATTRATESASVWSHTRPDGRPFYTVNEDLCYGENLSYNYNNPAELIAAWMASPSHRANLLDPGYTMVGVGTSIVNGIAYTTAEFF